MIDSDGILEILETFVNEMDIVIAEKIQNFIASLRKLGFSNPEIGWKEGEIPSSL